MNNFVTTIADVDFDPIILKLTELIDSVWAPVLTVLIALTVIWGIYVGLRFVTAGDDTEKIKKAKELLKYTIVGVIIAFALIVGLPLVIKALGSWAGKRI